MDYILNGVANGSVAGRLLANGMNPACLRPYVDDEDGLTYIDRLTANGSYEPSLMINADAGMRRDVWKHLDDVVLKAAQTELRAVGDLRRSGLEHVLSSGMAKTSIEHQTQSDISPAIISMDPIRRSDNARPVYGTENLPLPVIHKDFSFPLRQIMASGSDGGESLEMATAELAARKVAEEADKLLLGVHPSYAYGGGVIYGYTNFPSRHTLTMTAPLISNHPTTLNEILQMKQKSVDAGYRGPWFCYHSTSWDTAMDEDYSAAYPNLTLRTRIGQIEGIDTPVSLASLPAKTILLVQKTSDVIQEVVGMEIVTVQWESQGGFEVNFKVMAIMVPRLRKDYYGKTGIVHGTHA